MPPYLQKITVPYEYPVYFTSDVFAPHNSDLVEAVARREPSRRHRLLPVVERAVVEAWPGLPKGIHRYVEGHTDRLELADGPWVVEGGEAAKNDPAVLAGLQKRLYELRLDRHSFVVLVGGGALLDVGRLRGRHRPPRRPHGAASDHGARAERLRASA